MLNIILFGPPGSGKGTQAANLIDKYSLTHISTGDVLRAEITNGTDLGVLAKSFMDEGKLVTDNIVIGMMSNLIDKEIAAGSQGFIFDGFPRTVDQASALDKMCGDKGLKIDTLLSLEVDEEELVKRLLIRGETSGRSDDTDENIIRNRIVEYNEKTEPVASFYNKQSKLVRIQGVGSIEDITNALCAEIDQLA